MSAKDQQPGAFLPRPLKAIVIGAGFSGIQISRDIKVELPEIELELYPVASEIRTYLENTVDKHHLRQFIQFNWRCVSAIWNELVSRWEVEFQHTSRDEWLAVESDVLVYAVGRLNNYKIPTTEGLSSFEGTVAHTAAWPEGLDIRDKGLSLLEMEPVPCNVYQHYSQVRKSLGNSNLMLSQL
ncbi:monooxygenase [Penicillium chermesinum]|uniref:Monooxygenase n=1 Tax=Penicillium chermesinum TaxID=63820 RepID=A0A9W9PAB6_9EURO|nr:monooxygenase [Penicillium chermesinum]KAJ5239337.1 monooxygenase [Penicillium chermesinum]